MLGLLTLNEVNDLIVDHNSVCDDFESKKTEARDRIELHEVCESQEEFESHCNAIEDTIVQVELIKKDILSTQEKIEKLGREVIKHKQPADELTAEVAAYLGRSELVFHVKDNGYEIQRGGHIAKNLSEGEKTAIAFVYFLKTLRDSSFDLTESVIVIDDPISSLDSNSLFNAFSFANLIYPAIDTHKMILTNALPHLATGNIQRFRNLLVNIEVLARTDNGIRIRSVISTCLIVLSLSFFDLPQIDFSTCKTDLIPFFPSSVLSGGKTENCELRRSVDLHPGFYRP